MLGPMHADRSGPQYADLLLRGGTVIDGTGTPRFAADVAIVDDEIVALLQPGDSNGPHVAREIDCSGLVIAPGFIDVHTHDDRAVLDTPEMTAKLTQGVTTVVAGNCGISLAPARLSDVPEPLNLLGDHRAFEFSTMSSYRGAVDAAGPAVHVMALVGHSSLRATAMTSPFAEATLDERARMADSLAQAMQEGASGFSTGLFYATNARAGIDEVAELATIAGRAGGVYATHMRDEFAGVLDSLEESFETARRADIPLVISHHKCAGPDNWGRTRQTLPAIDAAAQNIELALDAYPYCAGSTVLLPELVDPRIEILISDCPGHPELRGRNLREIAHTWQCSQVEAAQRITPASAIYFQMDEADVRRVLQHPRTLIGSDGLPSDKHPHPRLWGTFPRVLGHYARDEGLFELEAAVHKMTGASAQRFGAPRRGVIKAGNIADLTVFNPESIIDTATFDQPESVARGIEWVIVRGRISLDPSGPLANRAGRYITGRRA